MIEVLCRAKPFSLNCFTISFYTQRLFTFLNQDLTKFCISLMKSLAIVLSRMKHELFSNVIKDARNQDEKDFHYTMFALNYL